MSMDRQVPIAPNGKTVITLQNTENSKRQQPEKIRRPKACTNCRKSKIKCIKSEHDQACKRCKAQGLQCVYEYKVPSYKVANGNRNEAANNQTHQKPNPIVNEQHPHTYLPSISLNPKPTTRREIPPINSILNPINISVDQFQSIPRLLNPVNGNLNNNVLNNNSNSNGDSNKNSDLISINQSKSPENNKWENSVEERLEGFGSKLGAILTLLQNQQNQQSQQSQQNSSPATLSPKNENEDISPKKRNLDDMNFVTNKRQKLIMDEELASSIPESPQSSEDFKEIEVIDPVAHLKKILTIEDARELFNFFNSNISPQLFGFDVSSYSVDNIWDNCPLLIATIGCIASIHHPFLSHISPLLEKIIYDLSKDILFNIPKTEIEACNTIVALCFCGFWFKNKQMFTGLAFQLAKTMNLVSPNSFKSSSKSFLPKKERLKLWYLLYILDGQQTLVFNRQSIFDQNDKTFKNSRDLLIEAENDDEKNFKNVKKLEEISDTDEKPTEDVDTKFRANYSDIRLVSQVEYHQAINAVFDGNAWDLLTPSSFGLPFKTNLELDKWMVQWTVLLSPFNKHPVWSSKSTLIYYNFAKLHINSSAVRKFQAMGSNLPSFNELDDDFIEETNENSNSNENQNEDKDTKELSIYKNKQNKVSRKDNNEDDNEDDEDDEDDEDEEDSFDIIKELSPMESRKVSAELALSAAETVLNIVLGDNDILSVLKYVPIHIHIMLYYAALLILKPHSCLNGSKNLDGINDDSKFESALNAIKLVKRLRHSIIINSPTDKEFSSKIVDGLTSILHDKVRQMKNDIITCIPDHDNQQKRLRMLDKVILDNDAKELYNYQLKKGQNFKISAWPGFDAGHPTKSKGAE